jgi:hypothetical protein
MLQGFPLSPSRLQPQSSRPFTFHLSLLLLRFYLLIFYDMMLSSLAVFSFAIAAVSAAPAALQARQFAVGPQCAGLGVATFDVTYNFTLAAYNKTLPNANDTGVPLVLGQNGAIDGAEFKVLSVRAVS